MGRRVGNPLRRSAPWLAIWRLTAYGSCLWSSHSKDFLRQKQTEAGRSTTQPIVGKVDKHHLMQVPAAAPPAFVSRLKLKCKSTKSSSWARPKPAHARDLLIQSMPCITKSTEMRTIQNVDETFISYLVDSWDSEHIRYIYIYADAPGQKMPSSLVT